MIIYTCKNCTALQQELDDALHELKEYKKLYEVSSGMMTKLYRYYKLSPQAARLLAILYKNNKLVHHEILMQEVTSHETHSQIIKVLVARINKAIRVNHDIIGIKCIWGVGYQITKELHMLIKGILESSNEA